MSVVKQCMILALRDKGAGTDVRWVAERWEKEAETEEGLEDVDYEPAEASDEPGWSGPRVADFSIDDVEGPTEALLARWPGIDIEVRP